MAPVPKRKRSLSEFSPLSSNPPQASLASLFSLPTVNFFSPVLNNCSTTSSSSSFFRAARHLPSRTYKRLRGSRPSEDEVHRKSSRWPSGRRRLCRNSSVSSGHTLNMLYTAQQRQDFSQPHPSPAPVSPDTPMSPDPDLVMTAPSPPSDNQQSLHHFWPTIPAPQPSSQIFSYRSPLIAPSACPDGSGRDSAAVGAGGNDDAMDIDDVESSRPEDSMETTQHGCVSCPANIPADEKQCLHCSRTKIWVGGIGWAEARPCVC